MDSACPNDNDGATSAGLSKAEQAAWEAPALRSTFTPDGAREQWAHPCPEWCTGDGEGHDPDRIVDGKVRQHQGALLRVRQDGANGYLTVDDTGREGVRAGHIEVSLVATSRHPDVAKVRIMARHGRRNQAGRYVPESFGLASLYPDEARELITVLQHLLKVGGQ